jgi:hypothetical protein
MQKVGTEVRDFFMRSSHLAFGFLPVSSPLLPAGHPALPSSQPLFMLAKRFRILNMLTVRADRKFPESQIDADMANALVQGHDLDFAPAAFLRTVAERIRPSTGLEFANRMKPSFGNLSWLSMTAILPFVNRVV